VNFEQYGGPRGYLLHVQCRALHALGAYRGAANIDWPSVRRLVFVCKGNICRSPYATARARSLGLEAVSFGLDTAGGAPADPVAARNALSRGLDLTSHRSARLEQAHLEWSDLIIVFEPPQLAAVRLRYPERSVAASLIGIWARPLRPHVHDPYGRGDAYFQECFSIIDANVSALFRHIGEQRKPSNASGALSRETLS
jgi:protein-tyrosine phosphatase